MDNRSTRREFLESMGRGTLLGALSTVVVMCGLRGRGQSAAATCPSGCSRCPILHDCDLPEARSERSAHTPTPARKDNG